MRPDPVGSTPDVRRTGRLRRVGAVFAAAAALAVGLATAAAPTASAAVPAGFGPAGSGPVASGPAGFAPPDRATVRPGSMTFTDGAQCTANFVYTDGRDTYIGQAAHCAGTGSAKDTDGCTTGSLPLGTPVRVEGATRPGTLAYSSWLTMQRAGETDPYTCYYNDFALVRLDPADIGRTNPTLPFYGGPVGVDPDGTRRGETVFGYGNSELRGGLAALRPKTGKSFGTDASGRTHTVLTLPPGIPGDSGSGYVSADGTALGVLSTLNISPRPGTNGITDLRHALDYANASGVLGGELRLVPGELPFRGHLIPIG